MPHLFAQDIGERRHLVAPQVGCDGHGPIRHPLHDRSGQLRVGARQLDGHEGPLRVRCHLQLAREQLRGVVRGEERELDAPSRREHSRRRHPRKPQRGADRIPPLPVLHDAPLRREERKACSVAIHLQPVASRQHLVLEPEPQQRGAVERGLGIEIQADVAHDGIEHGIRPHEIDPRRHTEQPLGPGWGRGAAEGVWVGLRCSDPETGPGEVARPDELGSGDDPRRRPKQRDGQHHPAAPPDGAEDAAPVRLRCRQEPGQLLVARRGPGPGCRCDCVEPGRLGE